MLPLFSSFPRQTQILSGKTINPPYRYDSAIRNVLPLEHRASPLCCTCVDGRATLPDAIRVVPFLLLFDLPPPVIRNACPWGTGRHRFVALALMDARLCPMPSGLYHFFYQSISHPPVISQCGASVRNVSFMETSTWSARAVSSLNVVIPQPSKVDSPD